VNGGRDVNQAAATRAVTRQTDGLTRQGIDAGDAGEVNGNGLTVDRQGPGSNYFK